MSGKPAGAVPLWQNPHGQRPRTGDQLHKQGHVVGVLVPGGGENINFAIPIGLACAKLRQC